MESHREAIVGILMLASLVLGSVGGQPFGILFTLCAILFVLWLFARVDVQSDHDKKE